MLDTSQKNLGRGGTGTGDRGQGTIQYNTLQYSQYPHPPHPMLGGDIGDIVLYCIVPCPCPPHPTCREVSQLAAGAFCLFVEKHVPGILNMPKCRKVSK